MQIHTARGICPLDRAELRSWFGSNDLFPEKEIIEALQRSQRVSQNSPAGYAIWNRSGATDIAALTEGAALLLDRVKELSKKSRATDFAQRDLVFIADADTDISDLRGLILKVLSTLLPAKDQVLEPLASDMAKLTEGIMYVDHATKAEVRLEFFWDERIRSDQFGYNGYQKRGTKDSTSHLIAYHGETGTRVKVVPDEHTAWKLFEQYHAQYHGRGESVAEQKIFSEAISSLPTAWANLGDVFSYVRSGSDTPPALISSHHCTPLVSVIIDPSNEGWFNYNLQRGARLGPFTHSHLEKLLGYRPNF